MAEQRQEVRRLERKHRLIEAGEMCPQTPPPTDDEDGDIDDGERAARGGESVWEGDFLDLVGCGNERELHLALRIEWAKAYVRKHHWEEEHNVFVWEQRGLVLPTGAVEVGFPQGAKAYTAKSAQMFREMKNQAAIMFMEPRLANGKKRAVRRVPILQSIDDKERDSEGEDSDEEEDWGTWDGTRDGDERGDAYSDEELFLDGEDEEM
ncbi:hypothetical protein B0H16DRAFT_1715750 [Mycena metata]|uniref:Uncharacterized protein n=1 Tax=Mycena metata TaxID=1033252 RepID=A0AAD7JTL2_9AGAR|nr:hypothetical protein B0H16DRAFT_1715750 [Mycena metata]